MGVSRHQLFVVVFESGKRKGELIGRKEDRLEHEPSLPGVQHAEFVAMVGHRDSLVPVDLLFEITYHRWRGVDCDAHSDLIVNVKVAFQEELRRGYGARRDDDYLSLDL